MYSKLQQSLSQCVFGQQLLKSQAHASAWIRMQITGVNSILNCRKFTHSALQDSRQNSKPKQHLRFTKSFQGNLSFCLVQRKKHAAYYGLHKQFFKFQQFKQVWTSLLCQTIVVVHWNVLLDTAYFQIKRADLAGQVWHAV